VAQVADDFGVSWGTVMAAVVEYGTPRVDDLARLAGVQALGVDETAFLAANGRHHTQFVTGMVDLSAARLLDVVPGRSGTVLSQWIAAQPQPWPAGVKVAALDPFRGYAKDDPLYRIRPVLRRGHEKLTDLAWERLLTGLDVGDVNGQVAAAWIAAQDLRLLYRGKTRDDAERRLYRWLEHCADSNVPELHRLARTIDAWRNELLAYFDTGGISNGPTEAMNLPIKKIKRTGHGFRNFNNYRLRLLLRCGVDWQTRSQHESEAGYHG